MTTLTIGQLAKRARVSIETIRFYERQGLMEPAARRASGYRQYPPLAVRRLRFIKRAQELGFSLREIKELLALRLHPRANCAAVRKRAEGKIAEIESRIADLGRMQGALHGLARACAGKGSTPDCPILEAFESDDSAGRAP